MHAEIITCKYVWLQNIHELPSYGRNILEAVLIFAVLLGIYFLTNHLVRRHEIKRGLPFLNRVRRMLKAPIILLLVLLSVLIPLSLFQPGEETSRIAHKLIYILTIVGVSWLLIRGTGLMKELILKQYDVDEKDNLKARKVYTQFKILENIVVVIIVIIGLSLILMSFHGIRKVGISLIASAGVIGIILGLAAQKLIGTFLAGIQLALTQPIRIDDVVIVENEWGWIEEINLTYVVIRIWDKRRLIVPANYFIEKPFQNWTRTSAEILGTVFLYTDYNVPLNALRDEVTRLLKTTKLWDGQVNVLQVTDAKERSMEVRVLVSSADSPSAWDLRVFLREKLIDFLQKNYPESFPKTRISYGPDENREIKLPNR
jgi:small-conductance mechanosensitive channel